MENSQPNVNGVVSTAKTKTDNVKSAVQTNAVKPIAATTDKSIRGNIGKIFTDHIAEPIKKRWEGEGPDIINPYTHKGEPDNLSGQSIRDTEYTDDAPSDQKSFFDRLKHYGKRYITSNRTKKYNQMKADEVEIYHNVRNATKNLSNALRRLKTFIIHKHTNFTEKGKLSEGYVGAIAEASKVQETIIKKVTDELDVDKSIHQSIKPVLLQNNSASEAMPEIFIGGGQLRRKTRRYRLRRSRRRY
jgi:hypothetical protein